VISSLDKAVADLSRCCTSGSVVWFGFGIGGFHIKGFGLITKATEESLKFETSGAHSILFWNMFRPKEIEYFAASEVDVVYLPAGCHPKGGWWRITTDANGILHIGELGEPPVAN